MDLKNRENEGAYLMHTIMVYIYSMYYNINFLWVFRFYFLMFLSLHIGTVGHLYGKC